MRSDLPYLDRFGEGIGAEALRLMARRWVIDEAWSWDHGPQGFTWIGQRLAQRFTVEGGRGGGVGVGVEAGDAVEVGIGDPVDRAGERARLVATTAVVEGVDDVGAARRALRGFNLLGKGSMWLHDAERGTIALHCGAELHPDRLEAASHDLSTFALLQLFTGEVLAESVAEAAGGRPAYRTHPISGARDEADEILMMVEQALVPIGMGPSQFADPGEVVAAAAVFDGTAFRVADDSDPLVVDASGPVGQLILSLRLDPLARDPDLGAGLLATVRLIGDARVGSGASPLDPADWAHRLNVAEREDDFGGPLYGAWEPEGEGGVIHSWFTPNALSSAGRMRDTMEVTLKRGLWAADLESS